MLINLMYLSVTFLLLPNYRCNFHEASITLYCIVLCCSLLYCIVLYCIALHCIVLYCIALYCIVLHCIILYCIVLYCIVLHYIVLCCIALYCIVLHCIALYCIASHFIVQCYSPDKFCDGQTDCINRADEGNCVHFYKKQYFEPPPPPPPPAVISFTKAGGATITPIRGSHGTGTGNSLCPDTHYQCPGNGYCLPVFTRCNAVYDCLGHEDEQGCESFTCPGHYRCLGSRVCLHPSHICDGIQQCPRSDDELLCDLVCPAGCTCYGLAFTCPRPFPAQQHPDLRYLNARGSGMTLAHLSGNRMLVYLSLAGCDLCSLANVSLPNVNVLDLSRNNIAVAPVSSLHNIPNLKTLFLSGNPLTSLLGSDVGTVRRFAYIRTLDLSLTNLPTVSGRFIYLFPNLHSLNLSQCATQRVTGRGFQPMTELRHLDMRGCPITEIQKDILQGLNQLEAVYADNFKLCCVAALSEEFNSNNCQAPEDEVSSCEDLLRSGVYRAFLTIFALLSLLGNSVSFVFRVASLKGSGSPGFSVFVLHLCASDFLMGVYLSVVGVADRMYKDSYVWKDASWRHSAACKLAGVISLVSCEVSAFIVCLITLDRLLVVRFPLSFLRFRGSHAQLASCLSWLVGLVLAAVPLLPSVEHWDFYSQTGICLPLPVTRAVFPGHSYSFGVIIVLNFILFLVIAAGQAAIYSSIRSNAMEGAGSNQQSQDRDIARRLFTIAMTDFLCWFPIGVIGLLAARGVPISGGISVALAIAIMPLNAAINPFLYTLNILLDNRRRAKEARLLKWIQSQK